MAYVQFALVCLFFGSNFILMDRATRYFGAIEIGLGRVTCAALLLGLMWALFERSKRLRLRELPAVAFVAIFANAYPYVLQPVLIGGGFGHSFFGMTVAFAPLLTVLVSIPLLHIKPTGRQMVGILGGLGFIFLLMYDGNLRGLHPLMLALAVTVPLSYAIGNTWMRRTLADAEPTPLSVVMLSVSASLMLPIVATPAAQTALAVQPPEPREDFAIAAFSLAFLGVMGTGLCTWAFVRMIQSRGPLFAGMVTYIVPVVAMMWGLFDNETITARQIIAIAGILSMVSLVQVPAKRQLKEANEEWQTETLPADA